MSYDIEELRAIAKRCEQAEEPDDQLNRDIAKVFGISWSPDEDGNFGGYNITPRRIRYTQSVDAVIELIEQVAPDQTRTLIRLTADLWPEGSPVKQMPIALLSGLVGWVLLNETGEAEHLWAKGRRVKQ